MTAPTQDQRREAIALARRITEPDSWANVPVVLGGVATTVTELRLLAETLLAAREAFADRLAPVYAAALAAVDVTGVVQHDKLPALRAAVIMARAQEPK